MKELLRPEPRKLDVEELRRSTHDLLDKAARLIEEAKIRLEDLRQSQAAREALLEQRRKQKKNP